MTEPVKWINGRGKVRWQPRLDDGHRARRVFEEGPLRGIWWSRYYEDDPPFLTSRRRAIRIARRERRRIDKNAWRAFVNEEATTR